MIGVLLRKNGNKYTLNSEIKKVIDDYNHTCICFYPKNKEEFISVTKLCDAFILQGGETYTELEIEMVRYLYEHDIPTLGICLGMQMMSVMDGKLEQIGNLSHKSDDLYVHEIIINEESKLFNIIGKKNIVVNSRHIEHITSTALDISAISRDGVIEAVENKHKKFFIGVQWHPESIMDENSIKIFNAFFNK